MQHWLKYTCGLYFRNCCSRGKYIEFVLCCVAEAAVAALSKPVCLRIKSIVPTHHTRYTTSSYRQHHEIILGLPTVKASNHCSRTGKISSHYFSLTHIFRHFPIGKIGGFLLIVSQRMQNNATTESLEPSVVGENSAHRKTSSLMQLCHDLGVVP